jgi:hypothetical protein
MAKAKWPAKLRGEKEWPKHPPELIPPDKKTCYWCNGMGSICKHCRQPEDECQCLPYGKFVPDDCSECEGSGKYTPLF